jgi:hypothetical protein
MSSETVSSETLSESPTGGVLGEVMDTTEKLSEGSLHSAKGSLHFVKDPVHFEVIEFAPGSTLLDSLVDATYVIHLVGNGRDEVMNQNLATFPPSQRTFVVHNRGPAAKPPRIDSTCRDIVDTNLRIFEHARDQGFTNILVLEDDFFFGHEIHRPGVIEDIAAFIEDQGPHQAYLYSLGCLPFFALPADEAGLHYYGPFFGKHACIFSAAYREALLQKKDEVLAWDWELSNPTCYFYHEPLCFQLFPATENRKNWGKELIPSLYHTVQFLADGFVPFFALDTSIKGYYLLYFLAKWWIFILVLAYLVVSFFFGLALGIVERVVHSLVAPLAALISGTNQIQVLANLGAQIQENGGAGAACPGSIPLAVGSTPCAVGSIPSVRPPQTGLPSPVSVPQDKPLIDYVSVRVHLPTGWTESIKQGGQEAWKHVSSLPETLGKTCPFESVIQDIDDLLRL